ncbi:hypothetical protein B0H17DRAFT_1065346 [Mycena rosella]|uniref:Secreted protein n=1 Tax=Mycena rosella TaxID=1033263 RepID=A0AAD7GJ12_MYCRO|nr:hypothetical protein B0H17DRAFT_1065346 [Mycena rosella]
MFSFDNMFFLGLMFPFPLHLPTSSACEGSAYGRSIEALPQPSRNVTLPVLMWHEECASDLIYPICAKHSNYTSGSGTC